MTPQALCIPELLEQILLNVDMCTLLTSAQRVCHYWNNVIAQSPALQQALFFQPANPHTTKIRIQNPLLDELFWEYTYAPKHLRRLDIIENPKASCNRMFFHQPPKSTVEFFMECSGSDIDSNRTKQLEMMDLHAPSERSEYLRLDDFHNPLYRRALVTDDYMWCLGLDFMEFMVVVFTRSTFWGLLNSGSDSK